MTNKRIVFVSRGILDQMDKHMRCNETNALTSQSSGTCLEKIPIFLLDKRNSITVTSFFTYYMVNKYPSGSSGLVKARRVTILEGKTISTKAVANEKRERGI